MTPTPFQNMAISLSGGGYRATTFHLGALSYLHSKHFNGSNLLEQVKILSTISGGTLTGIMYALKISEGQGYQECFDKLYSLLQEDKLVEHALENLKNPNSWTNEHKTKDLINAFAEVYNEHFFDQSTFAKLDDSQKCHLDNVIFGASEFSYGTQFRFQEESKNGRFGNGFLNLPKEVAREIRLGDAAAASSCFPGGFEPMIMPHDFGNGPDSAVDKEWHSKSNQEGPYPNTGIMDGGVIDNQGIEGVKLSEKRHATQGKPFVGTYIISDVSWEGMNPYEVPILKHSKIKNWFTFQRINILLILIVILAAASLIFGDPSKVKTLIAVSLLPLIIGWFAIFHFAKGALKNIVYATFGKDQVKEIFGDLNVLTKTPIYILSYLIHFRLTSVLKMVNVIFLKRIRQLQIDSLYKHTGWNYRLVSNNIYKLIGKSGLNTKMSEIVQESYHMPTTLWFSQKNKDAQMLDKLIACGQFTLCYNLIEYIENLKNGHLKAKVWDELNTHDQNSITTLYSDLKTDWSNFEKDPYWLVNQDKGEKSTKG